MTDDTAGDFDPVTAAPVADVRDIGPATEAPVADASDAMMATDM